jgi:cob(I)alamin adenosyltransferase
MGNRLSKISTRTGDGGTTGLGDGTRVSKDALRVETMGTIDELNSTLGLLLSERLPDDVRECLVDIQHDLFDLGGEFAVPGYVAVREGHVTRLDGLLERHNATLAPLKEFILPGGSRAAGIAHVARTVCRRAERAVVRLAAAETVPAFAVRYLNRLSDLLFVLARVLNRADGGTDVQWQPGRHRAG